MSLKELRFTLNVDGLPETATAVVGFGLYQPHSTPFALKVDIASGLPDRWQLRARSRKSGNGQRVPRVNPCGVS